MLDARPQLADMSSRHILDRIADVAAGATRSVAESCRLPTTRAKTGKRQSVEVKLAELKRRLLEIGDLNAAGALLGWDHATYMPQCGAGARARQSATLSK